MWKHKQEHNVHKHTFCKACSSLEVLTKLIFQSFLLTFFNRIIFTNIQIDVQVFKIDVQDFKILTEKLKNSQSSVMVKNECKQLCYYNPSEIKNSTHLKEKYLRLKQ